MTLQDAFTHTLKLPPEAAQWLLGLWDCIQVFDDVADGDDVTRPDLDRVIWWTLVECHGNPFWQAKQSALLPAIASMVMKWDASDIAERKGEADAKSYMWRAGFYDVAALVVYLCHGRAGNTAAALSLYGETLADYMQEFPHA